MALPPILSNLPLLRLLKPAAAAPAKPAQSAAVSAPEDTVSISEDAHMSTVAVQTRQLLEQLPVSLGLDPSFT